MFCLKLLQLLRLLDVLLVSVLKAARESFCTMTAIPVGLFSSAHFSAHAASPPFYLCAFCKLICRGSGLREEFCKILFKVHEMWQCSHTHNSSFTVGSFCFFASEMKYAHERRLPRSQPLSKPVKDVRKILMKRRSESVESSYDVFLGGSCNPTTWRKDVAIPKLKSYGISYYNPQVTQWIPELIELENQAKENAKVMMFVIDNQTRSVASMIESAHIAGGLKASTRRKLILILTEQSPPGSLVLGEPISEKEYGDLQQGRDYLRDLVEMRGIPVFQSIADALEVTNRCLKEDLWPQDVRRPLGAAARPPDHVHVPHLALGDKYLKVQEAFKSFSSDDGKVRIIDVKMAFKVLTGKDLPQECLEILANSHTPAVAESVAEGDMDDIPITFDQFCLILSEFKHQTKNGSKFTEFLTSIHQLFTQVYERIVPRSAALSGSATDAPLPAYWSHVYLGGSTKDCSWRDDIAIPLLKKHGLTHSIPFRSPWNARLSPLEMHVINSAQVLLFVITKTARCVAEMLVAVHYVGQGCSVVLCIQYLEDDVVIDGEKLSELAVKDYNRGRMYLSDLATRAGVPVFSDISEAVLCAAERC
ncbi:NDT-like domain-containing protein raw isoform X6 [Haemaphysalis longicornis]